MSNLGKEIYNRRTFIKQAGLGAATLCACGHLHPWSRPRASQIHHGRIPDSIPGRLDQTVPDQALLQKAASLHPFDLHSRMDLAISAMTCCTDPMLGYISYSQVHFESKPAHMLHTVGDFIDDMGRHTDAIWMIRSATSTRRNEDVARKMAQNAMDIVDAGYAWNPPEHPFNWWPGASEPKERWTHMPEATRIILGMISYYRATGDDRAMRIAQSMTHGLYDIAAKDEKYMWFPDMNYAQVHGKIIPMNVAQGQHAPTTTPRDAGSAGGNQPAAIMGLFLLPVLRYYEEARDEKAAELCIRFIDLVINEMPNFKNEIVQTHSSLATASGVLKAGHLFSMPNYVQWAQTLHDTVLISEWISDFGWVPENTSRQRAQDFLCCETCSVTDFLELALVRAAAGEEKFWDTAERIAMNQLLENQYLNADHLRSVGEKLNGTLPKEDAKWFTTDRVVERAIGGFPAFGGPNDTIQKSSPFSVQCCFGSGARGLYDAWYYTAQETEKTVRVNMMFSKRLPSAAITSYMPGRAALKIEMTRQAKLLVRRPGCFKDVSAKITVNGEPRRTGMNGSYYDFGALPAGSKVNVEFSDQIREQHEQLGSVNFTTKWLGNAIVAMEPRGEYSPTYNNRNRTEGVEPSARPASRNIPPI